MKLGIIYKTLGPVTLFLVIIVLTQCSTKTVTVNQGSLSEEILGVRLGMSKEDAEKRLREVADFEREADKRQELWTVKDKKNFNNVAVGYSGEGEVKFITAYSDKGKVSEQIRFKEIGDLSKAKEEITKPHHRYIWTVEATEDYPEHIVTIYGASPEFLSTYSISYPREKEAKEEEREKKEEKRKQEENKKEEERKE